MKMVCGVYTHLAQMSCRLSCSVLGIGTVDNRDPAAGRFHAGSLCISVLLSTVLYYTTRCCTTVLLYTIVMYCSALHD